MQTFLPYPSFAETAAVLDRQRLGKQRVEAWQILRTLRGEGKLGWRNHPAVLMWTGHERALAAYGLAICDEWLLRGYQDTMRPRFEDALVSDQRDSGFPLWLGNPPFHASHRANLLRKAPGFYAAYGWTEDPALPYVWPAPSEGA